MAGKWPFAINAPLVGAPESRNRDEKYFNLFLLENVKIYMPDFTQPLME